MFRGRREREKGWCLEEREGERMVFRGEREREN